MAGRDQAFQEFLTNQNLPAETRAVLENLGKTTPALVEGWLRQGDYDRRMNELKAERTSFEKNKGEWEQWYQNAKPEFDNMKVEIEDFRAGAEMKQADVEKLVSEQIQSKIAAQGGNITQEQIDTIVSGAVAKAAQEARESFYKNDFAAATQFTADFAELVVDHREEFGEKLDRKALSDLMREKNNPNLQDAYNSLVAEKRAEKKLAEQRKTIEAEVTKKLTAEMGVPGTSGPGVVGVGPLQQRVMAEGQVTPAAGQGAPVNTAGPLGSNSAAMQAAAEMRSEGKF